MFQIDLLIVLSLTISIGGFITFMAWLAPETLKVWCERYRIRMVKWVKSDQYFEYSTRPLVILWTWRVGGPMIFIMGLLPLTLIMLSASHMIP